MSATPSPSPDLAPEEASERTARATEDAAREEHAERHHPTAAPDRPDHREPTRVEHVFAGRELVQVLALFGDGSARVWTMGWPPPSIRTYVPGHPRFPARLRDAA